MVRWAGNGRVTEYCSPDILAGSTEPFGMPAGAIPLFFITQNLSGLPGQMFAVGIRAAFYNSKFTPTRISRFLTWEEYSGVTRSFSAPKVDRASKRNP